jgi:hypothetical protein
MTHSYVLLLTAAALVAATTTAPLSAGAATPLRAGVVAMLGASAPGQPPSAASWHCMAGQNRDDLWYLDCRDWNGLVNALPDEDVPTWRVPTFSIPMDSSRADELVRATMCQSNSGCQIRVVNLPARGAR